MAWNHQGFETGGTEGNTVILHSVQYPTGCNVDAVIFKYYPDRLNARILAHIAALCRL